MNYRSTAQIVRTFSEFSIQRVLSRQMTSSQGILPPALTPNRGRGTSTLGIRLFETRHGSVPLGKRNFLRESALVASLLKAQQDLKNF
jgi:hypothetical protein